MFHIISCHHCHSRLPDPGEKPTNSNSGSGNPRMPKGTEKEYKPPPSGPRVVMNKTLRLGPPKVQEVGDLMGKFTTRSSRPSCGSMRTTRPAPLKAAQIYPSASI